MYVSPNFKTKKALKDAVKAGQRVTVFAHGLGTVNQNGSNSVEGPHYPQPNTWYGTAVCKDGVVVKVS